MTLAAATRLGPYEIVAPLGAGGMGEVYRAKDTRLGREVAVKVLPSEVASDPERLRRFEQEARAASALSHPNILTLFDVGRHEATSYLVTELLEGESLRERLEHGALPPRKAIELGVAVARGLAAAHAKGIVHRDLKPENLFLTADGGVKILDFGLAKLTLPEAGGMAEATTIPGLTATGVVMGTAGYMAPEQVRGETADARSDLFALGCVLYEAVAGRRAFDGDTAPEAFSAILRDDPLPLAVAGSTGGVLEGIVRRCLEKRPDDRFQSARDLGFALEALAGTGSASGGATSASPTTRAPRWRGAPAGAALGVAVLLAGVGIGFWLSRREPAPPPRLRTLTSSGGDFSPALSPDGRTIAFGSNRDGRPRIWIRQLGSGGEAPLTEGHDFSPRFFPDGQSILYAHSDEGRRALHRIALVGGQTRKLIDDAQTGDVSPDGTRIAFVRVDSSRGQPESVLGLARADGGEVREFFRADSGKVLFSPRFAPDGGAVAVQRSGQAGARADLLLIGLDGAVRREIPALLPNSVLSAPAWSADGRSLYYVQGDSALGGVLSVEARLVRCDVASGRSTHLLWLPATASTVSLTGDGRLLFDAAVPRENLRRIPLAAANDGADGGQWLTRGFGIDRQPVVSPDGQRVIFSSRRSGNLDIWELTLATGAVRPLTDDPGEDWDPALTPDGRHLLWSSNRSGTYEIWLADADGSNPRRITSDGDAENPTATPDGRWIVYASGAPANVGLWKIRADGTEATRLYAGYQLNPEVSPDGEHVLYRFTLSGATRVQVRVLRVADGADTGFEIEAASRGSGREGRARWLRGGRAIAFTATDERGVVGVYAQDFVPGVDTSATRRKLGGFDPDSFAESFGVARDDSFLVIAALEQPSNLMSAENVPGLDGVARAPR
jgi:Tol biopolymer transport system component